MPSCWRLGLRPGAAAAFALTLSLVTAKASADPETAAPSNETAAYCARVRARAASEASLLLAPKVRAEAIKLPPSLQRSGRVDPTLGGGEYQARAGLVVSPVHMWKGLKVLDVADADCAQFEAGARARDLVDGAVDAARLSALRKQRTFLEGKRPAVEAVATKVEERFLARTATMMDADDVRAMVDRLTRQELQVSGEIARIEATAPPPVTGKVRDLRANVGATSRRFEEKAASARKLDAWDLSVTAGVVPPVFDQTTTDVYGVVALSWSFGGPFQGAAEDRYVAARAEEAKTSRASAVRRLDALAKTARAAKKQAEGELALVDRRIAAVAANRRAVEQSDASQALRQASVMDIEIVSLESERVFLLELVRELASLEEN